MKKIAGAFLFMMLLGIIMAGCGGSSGVSENKPISEVMAEAQTMSSEQLQAIIAKYQKVIESKQAEIVAIKQELQKIPLTQMLGEEAKKLKSDIEAITGSINALTERLNVYTKQLSST